MNNIENCLQNKIVTSSNKLQPTIFKAILNLYKKGFLQITARMVKEECIKIDLNIEWNNRLKAICNSMERIIECGFTIISENRPHNDFTISFDVNGNKLDITTSKKAYAKSESEKKEKPIFPSNTPHKNSKIELEELKLSNNFKVVMVCAGTKHNSFLTAYPNKNFVNNAVQNFENHPDEIMNNGIMSWRDYLIQYQNDQNLLSAYQLYVPRTFPFVYLDLYNKYKINFYILSAGWGLVNSEFKLPKYDITFSSIANPATKRNFNLIGAPVYNDFNQLNLDGEEDIVYIGSPDYIPLFFDLTGNLKNRKIIYWKGMTPQPVPVRFPIPNNTFLYRYYNTNTRMNWYYEVANDFCNGIIP